MVPSRLPHRRRCLIFRVKIPKHHTVGDRSVLNTIIRRRTIGPWTQIEFLGRSRVPSVKFNAWNSACVRVNFCIKANCPVPESHPLQDRAATPHIKNPLRKSLMRKESNITLRMPMRRSHRDLCSAVSPACLEHHEERQDAQNEATDSGESKCYSTAPIFN